MAANVGSGCGARSGCGCGWREGAARGGYGGGGWGGKFGVGLGLSGATSGYCTGGGDVVGCVVRGVGVGVVGWVGNVGVWDTGSSVGALRVGYARGNDVAGGVTEVVGAIVPEAIVSVTAIDAVGVWSGCSILNSTASEARDSNIVIWRGAGFNIVDPRPRLW